MALDSAYWPALKAAILADPVLAARPNTPDDNWAISDAFNLAAAPDFWVYKTRMARPEIYAAIVWTELIGRSVGERDTFQIMLAEGTVNPSVATVRQGFADIFNGPSGATTRTNLTNAARRLATRAEALFATGTGSTAAPATMGWEGKLSYVDVQNARNLP